MKTGTKSNVHDIGKAAKARLREYEELDRAECAKAQSRYKVRVSVLDTWRSEAEAYHLVRQMNESQVDKFTKKLAKELRKYA